jgi:group I intron endonuclease
MQIYKTINQINGKFYIGQDSSDKQDYLGSGVYITRAIKKYGRKNFIKIILEANIQTKEHLDKQEIYWISKLDAQNSNIGYNIAPGGKGGDYLSIHPEREMIYNRMSKIKKAQRNDLTSVYNSNEYHLKLKLSAGKRWKDANEHILASKRMKVICSSLSFRKKRSKSIYGRKNPRWKGFVYVYNPFGKLVDRFETFKSAAKALDININTIKDGKIMKIGKIKGYSFKVNKT